MNNKPGGKPGLLSSSEEYLVDAGEQEEQTGLYRELLAEMITVDTTLPQPVGAGGSFNHSSSGETTGFKVQDIICTGGARVSKPGQRSRT